MAFDWNPQKVAASQNGMVSTQHQFATDAGVEMLSQGGNAVDAAVASAFALCVCEPQACGLGGQTFMLLHLPQLRKNIALDGSSRAPNRAVSEFYSEKKIRLRGYRATTVPTTPATLSYAAKTYGTLPLSVILEPAIRLAESGYPITPLQQRLQIREKALWDDGNAKNIFLDKGSPFSPGDIFKQPALASTLRRIANLGVEDFYQGDIAATICEDMQKNDGLIQPDDLGNVPWPIERRPISCRFDSLRVMTFPPPGAGRTLVEMLNVAAHFTPKELNPDTPKGVTILSEIIRRAQLDRRDRPFDPNFYPQTDDSNMLSTDYAKLVAKQVRARISNLTKRKQPAVTTNLGTSPTTSQSTSGETTHLCAMDGQGNVVGITQSIERVYGSFVTTESLGFIYNNYMSAFEYDDFTHPYYLRPNAVPWASVAPTIVFKGRKPWLVIGSPGSERITSTIFQVLLRLQYQDPFASVSAPRFHCSASGRVYLESAWMRDDIPKWLESMRFTVEKKEALSFYLGCVQLIVKDQKTFIGIADPRRDGSAKGV